MKLISWNVNGLRAAWKKGLADFLATERPDVLCVQETKIQEDQLTDEMRAPDGYRSHWCFAEKKGYSGVATYTQQPPLAVAAKCGSPALDCEGRVIHTELADFHLLNVYFPNSGMGPERLAHKLKFYDEFIEMTERLRRLPRPLGQHPAARPGLRPLPHHARAGVVVSCRTSRPIMHQRSV